MIVNSLFSRQFIIQSIFTYQSSKVRQPTVKDVDVKNASYGTIKFWSSPVFNISPKCIERCFTIRSPIFLNSLHN